MEQILTNQLESSEENGLLSWVEDQSELSQKRLLRKRGKICSNACNKCKIDKKKCDGDSETKKACTNCIDRKRECKFSNVRRKLKTNVQNIEQLISRMEIIEKELKKLIEEISLIKHIKDIFFQMINPSMTNEQVIELRKRLVEELKKEPENQELFEDNISIETSSSSLPRLDSYEDLSSESITSPQLESSDRLSLNFNDLTAATEYSTNENVSTLLNNDYFQQEKQSEERKQTIYSKTERTSDERKRKSDKQPIKNSKKQRKNVKGTTTKQSGNLPGISVIYPTPKGYETHKFVASENTQYRPSPSPMFHLGLMAVNNLNGNNPDLQTATSTADSFGLQTSTNIEQHNYINQFVIQQYLFSNDITTDDCNQEENTFNAMPR
ncbi:28494_t:CDS:1 [Dentiscutata erythropus]|uniref:28494_t:CDS:1 n=1 Tax=Dentiscutata erythropus TaxID=1348616 RepID=A0A9N9B618_9GLOM|nr:28494_t:CDS:1 [Dentiscutata erythropus]